MSSVDVPVVVIAGLTPVASATPKRWPRMQESYADVSMAEGALLMDAQRILLPSYG